MKHILSSHAAWAGLALCCLSAAPAFAGDICLNLNFIRNTQVEKDGTSITFETKDGKVWRNDLRRACPLAWFNGFAWSVHAGRVCDNDAQVRPLYSGEICNLGKFTEITPIRR